MPFCLFVSRIRLDSGLSLATESLPEAQRPLGRSGGTQCTSLLFRFADALEEGDYIGEARLSFPPSISSYAETSE